MTAWQHTEFIMFFIFRFELNDCLAAYLSIHFIMFSPDLTGIDCKAACQNSLVRSDYTILGAGYIALIPLRYACKTAWRLAVSQ